MALGATGALAVSGLVGLGTTPAQAQPVPTPRFTLLWTATARPGGHFDLSAPTVATMNGQQAVVIGGSDGYLYAKYLSSGASVPGYPVATGATVYSGTGYIDPGLEGPVASPAGAPNTVYVESSFGDLPGQTPSDQAPDVEGFDQNGGRILASNPAVEADRSRNSSVPGYSGPALAMSGTTNEAYVGGIQQEWGINRTGGGAVYAVQNSDSALTTPAVDQVPYAGVKEVYEVSDQSYNPAGQGSFSGGHLRVIDSLSGKEVCNADIRSPEPNNNYGGGGFGDSPAVVQFGGDPLIVFGEGQRWTNSDQLLAYDSGCSRLWSVNLGGYTDYSPSVADVEGDGTPDIIELAVTPSSEAILYEISSSGAIIRQRTLTDPTTGAACINVDRYAVSQSVTTADLTGEGYQDLIAPAGTCGYVVLDGRTLDEVALLKPSCGTGTLASINTALVTSQTTAEGTLDVSIAGDNCISTYAVAGAPGYSANLGPSSWPEFHHDPQLTGTFGTDTAYANDVLGPNGRLDDGQALTSQNGEYKAVMQSDGNFVVYQGSKALWASGTEGHPGAYVEVPSQDNLEILSSSGAVLWQTHTTKPLGSNPAFTIMQTNGNLVTYYVPSNAALQGAVSIWASNS